MTCDSNLPLLHPYLPTRRRGKTGGEEIGALVRERGLSEADAGFASCPDLRAFSKPGVIAALHRAVFKSAQTADADQLASVSHTVILFL